MYAMVDNYVYSKGVEDCYFFVGEDERKISTLCTYCHDTKMPNAGMLYQGSKEGYGPFEYKCCVCKRTIRTVEENDEET